MNKEVNALAKRLKDLEYYVDDVEDIDWDHVENELEYIEENYVNLEFHSTVGYTPEFFEKRILELKRCLGLYVEEDELDRMFPDRHDPDFDEDSISWFDFDYFD